MNGGTGPDTFQFTAVTGTIGAINGGTGTSTIIGPAQANSWNITGTNTGSISGTLTTFNASTGTLNLTGGGSGDTFQFFAAGTINGTIDGTVRMGGDLDHPRCQRHALLGHHRRQCGHHRHVQRHACQYRPCVHPYR